MTKPKTDKRLFAMIHNADGFMEYSGRVERESGDTLRIELHDAFSLIAIGQLDLTGELRDFDRNRCRLFKDQESFAHACGTELTRADRQEAIEAMRK